MGLEGALLAPRLLGALGACGKAPYVMGACGMGACGPGPCSLQHSCRHNALQPQFEGLQWASSRGRGWVVSYVVVAFSPERSVQRGSGSP